MMKINERESEYHTLYTEKSEWFLGRYMLTKIRKIRMYDNEAVCNQANNWSQDYLQREPTEGICFKSVAINFALGSW